jgi:hypothetical protein
MKLTPYNKDNLTLKENGRYGYLHEILDEFCNSGEDCVKLEGWTHKDTDSCQSAFRTAIIRYNKQGVKCVARKGEVYLIKTE